MASTYSPNLKIELIGTGEQAGTWGTTTNTNLGTALEQAIVGKADITMSSTTVTLTLTDTPAAQNARALYLNLSGTPGGAADLVVPAVEKAYLVKNGTTGGFAVTIKVTGQTGVSIPNGKTVWVYNNGTDVVTAVDYIPAVETASLVATTADINGGSIDGATLGTNSAITSLVATTADINGGSVDGATLGTNSAITEAQVDNININGNSITSTNTDGNITLDPDGTGTIELSGPVLVSDNLVTRATLKDYAVEGQAVGNTGATRTLDLNDANFFSATLDQACTFTFADPPASGDFGAFVLELTNGGAFAITWPAAVDWPGGAAPTLTTSGKDQLVFTTRDAGTTWFGFVAGLDIK